MEKVMSFLLKQNLTQLVLVVAISSNLFGCASGGIQSPSGEPISDVLTKLESGEVRLSCGVACSGAWGRSARRRAKALYDNGLWKDLAIEVARVGFKADQTYYYLGRAAEELGYTNAARTYYKLGLANDYKCDGLLNNCNGLVFPTEMLNALNRLPVSVDESKPIATVKQSEIPSEKTTGSKKEVTNFSNDCIGNCINGKGKLVFPDGTYTGEWKDNKFNGYGTLTQPDGTEYVGSFKNGELNGEGILTYSNGKKYIGKLFKGRQINGQGELIYPDGKKYVGEIKNGELFGQGILTYPNGSKVKFKNGLPNQGTIEYAEGNKYIGKLNENGEFTKGTIVSPNKFKFVGEFKGGLPNQGTVTYVNGMTIKIKDGKPIEDVTKKSQNEKVEKENLTESEARKAVLDVLKDPGSAKFGELTQATENSACFTVNAKNSFGGYTGEQQALLFRIGNKWIATEIYKDISHETCLEAVIKAF
jgi:hypothetical protein